MRYEFPLVSCICITNNRSNFLKIAILHFLNQSYPNTELVIVCNDKDYSTIEVLKSTSNTNIIKVIIEHRLNVQLGELRNIGIRASTGMYLCMWDDDDWHHSNRITMQYQEMLSSDLQGSILGRWIVYDKLNNRSYLSRDKLLEGSIFCHRQIMLKYPYPQKNIDEDTTVINRLFDSGYLSMMLKSANLYVYLIHGANTWDLDHFGPMIRRCKILSSYNSNKIGELINNLAPTYQDSLEMNNLLLIPSFIRVHSSHYIHHAHEYPINLILQHTEDSNSYKSFIKVTRRYIRIKHARKIATTRVTTNVSLKRLRSLKRHD